MSGQTQQKAPGLPMERKCPFDPPEELGLLRETQPISPMSYPDGSVGWLVTSHAMARAVLVDARFSARRELRQWPVPGPRGGMKIPPAPPGMFIGQDPPDHTRYRRLLMGEFTVHRMRKLAARIEEIAERNLDAMEAAGRSADLVSAFALPTSSLVICELLGVPYEDLDEFQSYSDILTDGESSVEQLYATFAEFGEYFRGLIARKRAEPTDDLLSGLVNGGELTEEELINIGVLLLDAGHKTVGNMLAHGTFALLAHPEQLEKLRADPALVDGAVEELLRYLTIAHIGLIRAALTDVELGGQLIKAGDVVTISLAAANRDPARFVEPDSLDVSEAARAHLAFGHGIHQCLGQQLARIELAVGYRTLLRRLPGLRLAVPVEEVPTSVHMTVYGVQRLPVTW